MVGVNGIVLILVWKRGVGVFFDQIKLSSRLPGRKERIKQILLEGVHLFEGRLCGIHVELDAVRLPFEVEIFRRQVVQSHD